MRNFLIPLAALGCLLLDGCQGSTLAKPDAPVAKTAKTAAVTAKPMPSEEAAQALAKAEADIKEAKAKNGLWTTATDALKKAQEAAAKGDSAATLKFSKITSDQARLGLEQKNYPLTK